MISTHILDTSRGIPAVGISVVLQRQVGQDWNEVAKLATNADGRAAFDCEAGAHTYRLLFDVEPYFKSPGNSFYTSIPVVFHTDGSRTKYHIPLLLSPFGYSTYRGS
jgi:5-hydroxyisourate hydrolase